MLKVIHIIIALMVSSTLLLPVSAKTPPQVMEQSSISPILKKIMPAIVNIKTIRINTNDLNNPHSRHQGPEQQISLASGVIVNAKEGILLTNSHVIANSEEIVVTLSDGQHYFANVVGSDPASDIAVLQIQAEHLQAIPVGNSDTLSVGDFVVAIGNPFGLNQSVTSGIVSALGRNGLGIEGYEDFIQTDASINLGNSGGALINLKGELVGINTAIIAPDGGNIGIGFAIPVNMAEKLMQQLIEYGEVRRGLLGVVAQPLNHDIAELMHLSQSKGALVAQVTPNSIAYKAGFEVGDLITQINERKIQGASDLRNEIGLVPVGDKFTINIIRDHKPKKFTLKMTDPNEFKTPLEDINTNLAGLEFGKVDKDIASHGHIQALELINVDNQSGAYKQGLRRGDIITSLNQHQVHELDDINKYVKKDQPILMRVIRHESAFFLVLKS